MEIEQTTCCGVHDINGFEGCLNPEEVLEDIIEEYDNNWQFDDGIHDIPGALTFTLTAGHFRKGTNLIRYIHRNKLGKMTKTLDFINPNTRRKIRHYIWAVDRQAFFKWAKNR